MNSVSKYAILISICVFILVIFFVGIKQDTYEMREESGLLIAADVAQLKGIFERIHKTCRILSFDYQKNPINFLNVVAFKSSEVGPMNLVYPKKWEGPYLNDNPAVQGIEYQIVHTNDGYFITPGEGVVLPSGKQIGKDVMLDKDADIGAMLTDPTIFLLEDRDLAGSLQLAAELKI
ncbi:MAG TPA: hypothetical protein PLU71_00220 [Candidatus Dependentiae bacterium]|nr:hypothetical protein [Candidatus Dependentiae bacterium]HRQ62262.1 hypothetical protein [Candidatus Dependentiae bacterium]